CEVIDGLHQRPDDDYPAFDLERVGEYVTRGFRPALLQLICLLPVMLFAGLAFWAASLGAGRNKEDAAFIKVLASILPLGVFVLLVLSSWLLLPFLLRCSGGEAVAKMSAAQFAQDFLKHVWREAFLAQVFVVVTGLSMVVFGLVPCGFGAPPALALAGFSQFHLLGQLYALYLQRCGGSVPEPATEAV